MSRRASIREFLRALGHPHTYAITENIEAVFGVLWGLPVPLFALGIHVYAAKMECCVTSFLWILQNHPIYILFLVHPILFGIVFGALGTMRMLRDQQIQSLLKDVEQHCEELSQANIRLEEIDRLKTEFMANVTHELKSPLVTALGYTERILGGNLGAVSERQEKGLAVSKRNLIKLRSLIDEILDFSRLDAGMVKFNMQPTNLADAVRVAVENLTLKASERKIEISAKLPPADEGAWVNGELQKLSQVVTNLIDNAVKYSHAGGKVRVTLGAEDGLWHLRVEDEGRGIPAAILPKLFTRFVQADGSLGRPHEGVGLGLVIVKKIVELHGGKIWIESQENVGTQVHVQLPMGAPPASSAASTVVEEEKEATHATHTAD